MNIDKAQAKGLVEIMNDYADIIRNGNEAPLAALGRIAGEVQRNGFKIEVKEIEGTARFVLA